MGQGDPPFTLNTVHVEIFVGTVFRGLAPKTGKLIFGGF